MNFLEAVNLLKQGQRIRRACWSTIGDRALKLADKDYVFNKPYEITRVSEYFSLSDIEADDWEIYKEEPKTYTFQKAFEAFMEGKTISRRLYVVRYRKEHLHKSGIIFSYDDVLATDWIIIEE